LKKLVQLQNNLINLRLSQNNTVILGDFLAGIAEFHAQKGCFAAAFFNVYQGS